MTDMLITAGARTRQSPQAWIRIGAVATGVLILLARPTIAATLGWTVAVVAAVFATILALGLVAPVQHLRNPARASNATVLYVLIAGTLVFLLGRLLKAGQSPMPATPLLISLNTLAAVGEEALFRRVAFDALLPAGPIAAIGGSALLFGLAHVTVYGWWAFPLDVAAGILLGWQRWASGSWGVPAITHALADLLVVV
jgi:membrane protease YdiL (CAAX protease family)